MRGLRAGYGPIEVLRGVDLDVGAGELVAVLGPNGAGKSTLLRAISGVEADVREGTIRFADREIGAERAERRVRRGLLHVPEGRALFAGLSVEENLRLGGYTVPHRERDADLARVLARFPRLGERRAQRAAALSGGEQQMLAIGRALMARPRLLMLDEPSTGLAPRLVAEVVAILRALVAEGIGILVVEQNAALALRHADRALVLEGGAVALAGPAAALRADPRVRAIYLGGTVEAT